MHRQPDYRELIKRSLGDWESYIRRARHNGVDAFGNAHGDRAPYHAECGRETNFYKFQKLAPEKRARYHERAVNDEPWGNQKPRIRS